MDSVADAILDGVRWHELHVCGRRDASHVPRAVHELVNAQTAEQATKAYWELDNWVVVQGSVFDAAEPLVGVLLAYLAERPATAAVVRILDLLVEMHDGAVHPEEQHRSNAGLADRCTAAVAEGKWLYHTLLMHDEEAVRRSAIDLLSAVGPASPVLHVALAYVVRTDRSEIVQTTAKWWLERL